MAASAPSTPDGNGISDLEVIPPEGEDAERPHPLGPRDVIEVLSAWSRIIVTAVVVLAVGVGGFILGRTTNPTINESPRATTGVLWECDGQVAGSFYFAGVRSTDERLQVPGITQPVNVVVEPFADGVRAEVSGTRLTRRADRVTGHYGNVEISVPVLRCQE